VTDVFFHIVRMIMLGLSSLNDWISHVSLAYITREKSVVLPEDWVMTFWLKIIKLTKLCAVEFVFIVLVCLSSCHVSSLLSVHLLAICTSLRYIVASKLFALELLPFRLLPANVKTNKKNEW